MEYDKLPSKESVERTMESLKSRGIYAEFVNTKEEAFEKLKSMIPAGREVMTGASVTLEQIGFTDLLKSGRHEWNNLKDKILAEKDFAKQMELRKKSVMSEYFIGSVHAVAETGVVLVASNTGSQIPSYAFTSSNVIWVAGTQKIVPNVEEGLNRIWNYCLPMEDAHMKSMGYPGSRVGKILIFERESMPNRKIHLIFINEKLGF
jgi:L-lactate utilization protein LutB